VTAADHPAQFGINLP